MTRTTGSDGETNKLAHGLFATVCETRPVFQPVSDQNHAAHPETRGPVRTSAPSTCTCRVWKAK